MFLNIVAETLDKGGNVIIPSFAVGRTQEILYELNKLKERNKDNEDFKIKYQKLMDASVFVDSPLAISATEVFKENMNLFDDEVKADIFAAGEKIDVQGTSKGKGFQGVIKRHGQHRGPMGHGSMYHRRPGSMGSTSTPGRVFKGKKLPGHMGKVTVTIQNLDVVRVDMDKNVILVKGSVPGPKGAILKVKSAVKASK